MPDGANIEGASVADEIVTAENASRYIAAVVDDVLGAGVEPLFRKLAARVLPTSFPTRRNLPCFLSEIDALTCGVDEQTKWTERDLREHILCDHGYQVNSKPVVNLREILTNMSDARAPIVFEIHDQVPSPDERFSLVEPKIKSRLQTTDRFKRSWWWNERRGND